MDANGLAGRYPFRAWEKLQAGCKFKLALLNTENGLYKWHIDNLLDIDVSRSV